MNNSLAIQMTNTKEKIIAAVNESNLPACILYEIFLNITNEIGNHAQLELQQDKNKKENDETTETEIES